MPSKPKLDKASKGNFTIDAKSLDNALKRISLGCPYKIACRAEGFSYAQFKNILAQGELDADHHLMSTQSEVVKKLRAMESDRIEDCIAKITSSEKGHAGSQWFLERKHWKDFSSNAAMLQMAEEMEALKAEMAKANQQRGIEDEK